jgi:hypothetical protein
MNKLLALAAVGTALIVAAPASAQVSFGFGGGPNGFGVHIGPNAPDYNWRADRRDNWRGRDFRNSYGYGGCETVRERTVNRSGRVVYSTHRICD